VAFDFTDDVSHDAAHNLAPSYNFSSSSCCLCFGFLVIPHSYDGHAVDIRVGLTVAAAT